MRVKQFGAKKICVKNMVATPYRAILGWISYNWLLYRLQGTGRIG